ncbi:MAG: hypothetical protein P5681_23810, partial [Limnospira sp. PMC 894.15]|uniref:hypothetical protein n=1 Tax=Limnospira sp. PMC 894.15 TaxID=2981100 RepID=UPI0028E101CD
NWAIASFFRTERWWRWVSYLHPTYSNGGKRRSPHFFALRDGGVGFRTSTQPTQIGRSLDLSPTRIQLICWKYPAFRNQRLGICAKILSGYL